MYRCVCVRIAYLQACKAIDSENKIKQQSPTHTRTHTQTLPFTHTCTHSSTHSLSCSTSPFLSLSHSLALQHNEGNWAESLPLAVFCNLPCGGGGGGRALQQATTSASTQQVAAQRYARQSSAAQRCSCLLLLWLRCPFAFRIPHPDAAKGSEALSTASCGVRSWLSVRDEISWLMDVCSFPRFHSSTTVDQHQQPPVKQRLNRHLWHFEEDVRRYLRAENVV